MRAADMTSDGELDDDFYGRCLAAGGKLWRGENGQVLAAWLPRGAKLSVEDCRRWRAAIRRAEEDAKSHGVRHIVEPNPANLLGGREYWVMPQLSDQQVTDALRASKYNRAAERVQKLMRHSQLRDTVSQLSALLPVEEGRVSSDPFWYELAQAEMLALAYDAAKPVVRDRKRQRGARIGGKSGGRTKTRVAEAWHAEMVDAAQKLLVDGKNRRDLASILAVRFQKTARTIRTVLKKAEV